MRIEILKFTEFNLKPSHPNSVNNNINKLRKSNHSDI